MKTVFGCLLLLGLSACGSGNGAIRSADEIKAVTDKFVVGTTTISETYDALGMWSRAEVINTYGTSDVRNDEFVVYKTSDGGETHITFVYTCRVGFPNCKDANSSDIGKANLLFSSAVHID